MCLRTSTPIPNEAEQDITCYKVLVSTPEGYFTPFRSTEVSIPGRITANVYRLPLYDPFLHCYLVEGEGVHAYTDIWSARGFSDSDSAVVVECTIPAGTGYWEGMDSDIAAREMRIEKIIN